MEEDENVDILNAFEAGAGAGIGIYIFDGALLLFGANVSSEMSLLIGSTGPVDGVMGPNTMAALEKFQQENDLAPTGRLNAETLEALEIDNQSMYNDDLEDSAFAE